MGRMAHSQVIMCDTSGCGPFTNTPRLKKVAIIMDEIDGVSGSNDRGGIAALIKIIENSKMPVICICNDRQNSKIRSLAYHCLDIKFFKYL